ncbi:MAG: hypothetical protein Ct9H300mP21_08220 [Pseudomonadota bacterium]|nr:MAG: hypothetical protein Ct9H300mP21_08220 [Pseudomonadota bacterium]
MDLNKEEMKNSERILLELPFLDDLVKFSKIYFFEDKSQKFCYGVIKRETNNKNNLFLEMI